MSFRQDEEHAQSAQLLVPTPEYLASVKVFPLIPNLKKDIMVSLCLQIQYAGCSQLLMHCRKVLVGYIIHSFKIYVDLGCQDSPLSWE